MIKKLNFYQFASHGQDLESFIRFRGNVGEFCRYIARKLSVLEKSRRMERFICICVGVISACCM